VGLNSDAWVRRLKGPTRPVQGEAARAAVLASLASVHRVVIFGEDTPLALIEALKPDVLVKGADYSLDQVVGAELVQRYGGRVLLAALAPGHSTTATIERLARGGGFGSCRGRWPCRRDRSAPAGARPRAGQSAAAAPGGARRSAGRRPTRG